MSKGPDPKPEPYLLLGRTRRGELRETLEGCAESWRQRWSTAADPIRVEIAEGADDDRRAANGAAQAFAVQSAAHGALFLLHAGSEARASLFGLTSACNDFVASAGAHGIAAELQTEALRSLCADLARAAGVGDCTIGESTAERSGNPKRARGVSVTFTLGAGRARVGLVLTPHFAELLSPPTVAARKPDGLVRRRNAIADESLRIEAVLGEVEVSLSDLARLSEGDVIVLDHALAGVGHLQLPDGRRIANATLGSAGAYRAVSVTT